MLGWVRAPVGSEFDGGKKWGVGCWAGAGGQKVGEICLIRAAQEAVAGPVVQDVLQHVEVAESPCSSCLPTAVFSCFPSAVGEVWFEAAPCPHL